jgi:hypothetical protein
LDHRSYSVNLVGAGIVDGTRDGRIYSYPSCDCHRRGSGTDHPGTPANVTTSTITTPTPQTIRYLITKKNNDKNKGGSNEEKNSFDNW